jgi:hypothetical protein
VVLVFSQPLAIIPSMPFTCVYVECNHPQIWGLKLLILKSMSGSFQSHICCLITFVVHLLKWTLNACFKGRWIMTFTSCNSLVQLVGINTTSMFGCSFLIQSRNSLLLCMLQQSINHTSF